MQVDTKYARNNALSFVGMQSVRQLSISAQNCFRERCTPFIPDVRLVRLFHQRLPDPYSYE